MSESPHRFLLMTNGHSIGKFPYDDDPIGTASRSISTLDGDRRFSKFLSENLADPLSGPSFIPAETDFIQCAGNARALTVELSETCEDGAVRRWVLGREGESGGEMVTIHWSNTGSVEIAGHEAWTAEQAAELFVAYYEGGPQSVAATRRLDNEVTPSTND